MKNPTTSQAKLPKTILQLQPNKTCKCEACKPPKTKLPEGTRRLKVYYKYVNGKQIPVVLLQGEWIRKLGFEIESHLIITPKKGELMINLEKE